MLEVGGVHFTFFTKGYLKKKQKTKNMQQKPYVACKAKNI